MKRITAYISLVGSMLLASLVGLVPALKMVNGTGDYSAGRTYVYKISERNYNLVNQNGTSNEVSGSDEDKQTILDEVVDEFKVRLSNADVTNYKLETSGFDTIKVTFKADSSLYSDISSYLNFSWSFKASTYKGDVVVGQDAIQVKENSGSDNFFDEGSARIEYKDNYPYVVVKLKNPEEFKNVVTTAKNASSSDTTTTSSVLSRNQDQILEDDDSEDTSTSNINKVYILNDWLTGMNIETLLSSDGSPYLDKTLTKNYVLYSYDATSASSIYWDYDSSLSATDQENAVYEEIFFGGYNTDSSSNTYGSVETDRVLAYKKANIWMHKFNSTTYSYGITLVNANGTNAYSSIISPFLDHLVYMNEVNWTNSLFVASLIAIVIVSLFLCLHYGVNGVTIIVNSFSLLVASIGLFNLFGSEFNVGAIIGLLTLMVVSIFSGAIFFKKANNELYKGKNIKKAFQEGSKRSFMIQFDISLITMILGITSYLIPTSNLISFGSLLIVGSILNVILNIAILRPLTWLIYNSSVTSKKLNLISVNAKEIPNLSKDEKPTYFDKYNRKQPKRTYNVVGIVASILLCASIAGLTAFQVTRGNIYNSSSTQGNTEVVIRIDVQNVTDDEDNTIESNIETIENVFSSKIFTNESKTKALAKTPDVKTYNYSYIINNVTNKEYYYVVSLDGNYATDSTAYYLDNSSNLIKSTLEQSINISVTNVLDASKIDINSTYNVTNDSNNYYALLFVSIGVGVVSIYMLLRFGLSKMLTSAILVGGSMTIVVGIFSLLNGPFTSVITLGTLLLTEFAYITFVIYFNKEKEIVQENKKELTTLELKRDAYEVGFNDYYPFIASVTLITALMIIAMFFTQSLNTYLLVLVLVGFIVILILQKALSINIELFFNKIFKKFIGLFNKPSKKKKNTSKKEDGPEEAIFIGIND